MSAGLDAVEAYLDKLPQGIDSHPECQTKASAVTGALRFLKMQPVPGLPPQMSSLLTDPPLPSEWVPEVHFHAWLIYAAATFEGGEDEFTELFVEGNKQLLNRFAYRVMFRLIGPRKVFTSVGRRWATFHRGTEVSAGQLSARGGVLRWKVPPHHCPVPVARVYVGAAKAAILVAGARTVDVRVQSVSPSLNEFACRWR